MKDVSAKKTITSTLIFNSYIGAHKRGFPHFLLSTLNKCKIFTKDK